MTITSYDNRRIYTGDGNTTLFAFPPPFASDSDLVVQRQEANGTIATLDQATDYAVTGAGNPAGGTVTTTFAPAVGTNLIIYRDVPLTQPTVFLDGGPLPAATINGMFDRITMWGQRLKEQIGAISGLANTSTAGLMSATDKSKLDSIATGAQVNAVTTVAGRAGNVILTKSDVGLGNVENTADASKPVSTAQAAADALRLLAANNLSDLTSIAEARTNLGATTVGTNVLTAENAAAGRSALGAGIGDIVSTNNLSDLANAGLARGHLGLAIGTDVQAYNARLAELAGINCDRGDLAYFNGTSLVKLSPGLSGQFLKTQGTGANPLWSAIAGGGDLLSGNNLSDVTNAATARTNLGATATGASLFIAADAAAGRAAIGAGTGNGTVTSVALSVPSGLSVSNSPITGNGALNVSWNGVIPVANGSTGLTSYTIGDVLYASGSSTLSTLGSVAAGNALISGGNEAAPAWGKIGLASHITGTLSVGNGGTNITNYATGDILYASGASTLARLAAGSNGQVLTLAGGLPSWTSPAVTSGSLLNIQVFTSSGIYTPTPGATCAKVTVIGGGGGGGGCGASNGSAGGGGGAGKTNIAFLSSLTSQNVTIGGGGAGGSTSGSAGGAGGMTSFGSITAGGGSGGQSAANDYAAGGAGSTVSAGGTFAVDGGGGNWGGPFSASIRAGGTGGASSLGGGGLGGINGTAGTSAGAYGAGGGGATGASKAGGNGATGIVIIEEHK